MHQCRRRQPGELWSAVSKDRRKRPNSTICFPWILRLLVGRSLDTLRDGKPESDDATDRKRIRFAVAPTHGWGVAFRLHFSCTFVSKDRRRRPNSATCFPWLGCRFSMHFPCTFVSKDRRRRPNSTICFPWILRLFVCRITRHASRRQL